LLLRKQSPGRTSDLQWSSKHARFSRSQALAAQTNATDLKPSQLLGTGCPSWDEEQASGSV